MKKLILSILFIAFVFASIGQNLKGYYVEAFTKLEAKRAFVIDLDTFYATTQLSGIDTILATKEYVKSRISNLSYDSNWNGVDSVAPSKNAVYDKIESMSAVSYCPATMTVNRGTLNTGTITDLCAVGGTDVSITELSGTDPLRVTFQFLAVNRMNYFTFYGDYSGGASHVVWVEIYNPNTTTWDYLGQFGTSATKQWYAFPIFTPNTYISAGAVQVRLNHQGNGIATHGLILDYVDINFGGAGGGTNIAASTITFAPTGNISSTNVQTAIAEVDSEKAAGAASSTDNAIARFDGTTGKIIQNSGVTISDADAIVTPSTIQATTSKLTNLTDGYIPYHISDASGLANSYINQINLGINISSGVSVGWPVNTGTAQTYAVFRLRNSTSNAILDFGNNGSGGFWLQHTNVANLSLNYPIILNPNGGNVLIGTTTNGLDKFQVNGSILATTAKFTNLTDNYIVKHTSDATGLENSNIFFSGNIARYGTANTFSNDRDIVDKAYVDAIAAGNMAKLPVDAATTANITLSGTQTIDGYAVTAGMRVLVKNQSTASQNGVYTVSAGAWARSTDLDTWAELYKAYVAVLNGTTNGGASYVCTIASTGTLGTDPITWVLYNAPANILVNSPLSKTGNTISLNYDTNTLDVASGNLKVKDNVFQPLLNGTGFVKASGTTITYDNSTYLTAETDPIFAADSANLLHWSDTLNTTKGIATPYDLTNYYTKTNLQTSGQSSVHWDNITNKPTVCNYGTQTLSGTTDTLNVSNGVNGILDISGNTTIRIEPTATCNTGNITVICDAAGYTLTFTGGTMKFSPYIESTSGVITTTNTTGAIDVYSWWYDGTRIIINGTKNYE